MSIVVYHHPYSRATSVVWMLEELGLKYELRFVDILAGEQKQQAILALNPMGKLPIVQDGDTLVTELAAIGLYLADKYAPGRLAPALDAPARGTYLRWALFSPSVLEPGSAAKAAGWAYKESAVGWGNYEAMLTAMHQAVSNGDYLLGETFSMADIIFGGTMRFMLTFKMLEPTAAFTAYVDRLNARPAFKKADAINAQVASEHGLGK